MLGATACGSERPDTTRALDNPEPTPTTAPTTTATTTPTTAPMAPPAPPPGVSEERSNLVQLAPNASYGDVAALVANDTDFAFALNKTLDATQNLIFSPHSISSALAMLYAGAAGTTKSEIQTALHFAQTDAVLDGAMNTLDQALASRGASASSANGEPFRLRVSNALWGQDGMRILPTYLDVLAQNFGAGVNTVNFVGDPEDARLSINALVSQQTEQKIPELLPEGSVTSDTRFVLTNAVYFNAGWAVPFDRSATSDEDFTLLDGSRVSVPVMHASVATPYAEGEGYQAVEIPYDGSQVELLAILPAPGTFAAFSAQLGASVLADIDARRATAQVELSLPRFEIRTEVALNRDLMTLGMTTAFSDSADFSGIDGGHDLTITAVLHQAFIGVDEEHTEAAAATAVAGGIISVVATPENKVFDARQPFLFAIRDVETRAILFWGQVVNPGG